MNATPMNRIEFFIGVGIGANNLVRSRRLSMFLSGRVKLMYFTQLLKVIFAL